VPGLWRALKLQRELSGGGSLRVALINHGGTVSFQVVVVYVHAVGVVALVVVSVSVVEVVIIVVVVVVVVWRALKLQRELSGGGSLRVALTNRGGTPLLQVVVVVVSRSSSSSCCGHSRMSSISNCSSSSVAGAEATAGAIGWRQPSSRAY